MFEPNDRSYYLARAEQSRSLAARAVSPAIAAIHDDLARRYDALGAINDSRPRRAS